MGVKNHEYLIFKCCKEKQLEKLRKFILKALKKDEYYRHYKNCAGTIGGGCNGHYSMILYPTGLNGGWDESFLYDIKGFADELNYKDEKRVEKANEKAKAQNKNKHIFDSPISWFLIAYKDEGIVFDSCDGEDFKEPIKFK